MNPNHIIRGQAEPSWKLAGYSSYENAVSDHFIILDAATRMLRHWVEGSRKHWAKFPHVTNDGRRVLLTAGNKIMPIDPMIVGLGGNDPHHCLMAIKQEWSRTCMML